MLHLASWPIVLTSLLLPMAASAQSTPLDNPLGANTTPWELFSRIASGLNFVTGVIALVVVVVGGYMILTAAGNSERFGKGKRAVVFAIIGLIVTTASYTILITTINVLTGGSLPSFRSSSELVDPLSLTNDLSAFGVSLYGGRVLKFMVQGLGALTVLMFVWAGFLWLTAAGNQTRIEQAKKTLGYAIIGVVLVLSSYIFITFAYAPFVQALQ